MIDINTYILEKLAFKKGMHGAEYPLIEYGVQLAQNDDWRKGSRLVVPYAYREEARDREKMRAYHDKGSKPTTLVNSIKDRDKLLRRFWIAMEMGWYDCGEVFGAAIIQRGYYTKEEVGKWIAAHVKDYKLEDLIA